MKQTNLSIGLINPKSPANVGSVMRAAGCFQADSVFYTGERYAKAVQFNTDTKNISSNIPLVRVSSLLDDTPENLTIVCVDLIEGAVPLAEFRHPDHALYIFGPEDSTINQDIIDQADASVYIPTIGCLNLAASVNIVLYDRSSKSATIPAHDELIRQSRDTNNKMRVNKKPWIE